MEIRRLHFYIIINCALIYYIEAKTFSLNEAIAAESKDNQQIEIPPHDIQGNTARRYPSKKHLTQATLKLIKKLEQGNPLQRRQKISPLVYRKTFQINSPLKPRKLKFPINLRHKRKNQSVKREINGNEKLKQKYIPLLKSLSMLFDNLLNSDASESYEGKRNKYNRNRYYINSQEESGDVCPCAQKSDSTIAESRSQEKTITSASSVAPEISIDTEDFTTFKTTSTPSNFTSSTNISRLRPNKSVSILFPRNTFSARRNNNGISERSSATYNRNAEGNLTGNYGNSEHNARFGENESNTESNEENTDDAARDDASGDGFGRGIRGDGNVARDSKNGNTADEIAVSENENSHDDVRENKFQDRGNETEGTKPISESIRRLRGFVSESKVSDIPESIQSKEVREKSDVDVTLDSADDQRIIGGSSPSATKNQEIRTGHETVIPFETHSNFKPSNKAPVVMIFDGYSVTRDKNGENKLAEKSIRIHS